MQDRGPKVENLRNLFGMMTNFVKERKAGIRPGKRVPTKVCRICRDFFDFMVLRHPGEPREATCPECQKKLDSGLTCFLDGGKSGDHVWFDVAKLAPGDAFDFREFAGKCEQFPEKVFAALRAKLAPKAEPTEPAKD